MSEIELSEQAFNEISDKLAKDQRGKPESAMLRLQHSQIAQLYGFVAEHTGDLTHRMAQEPRYFHGNYSGVQEKVEKVLRRLNDPYGFEREFDEQIDHNLPYLKYQDHASALAKLKQLGEDYANEHRKLVVANEAQGIARDAAIAVGEFRFNDARRLVKKLKDKLDEGPDAWEKFALSRIREKP